MALSLANFHPSEGTVTAPTTITFPWKAKEITILNNSTIKNLSFKFHSGESYGTLNAYESVTVRLNSKTVFLNGDSVAYRVWAVG
jgi:hypothetical protein